MIVSFHKYKIVRILGIVSIFVLVMILTSTQRIESTEREVDLVKIKKRLQYLCLDKSLIDCIVFDEQQIRFVNKKNPKTKEVEFSIKWSEVPSFIQFSKVLTSDSLNKIYKEKSITKFLGKSLIETDETVLKKGLKGKRIAIDPGHFAGNLETAKIEQKFLDFKIKNSLGDSIPIQIAEGILTWQTAQLLKTELEKEGAIVLITRPEMNSTSFGCSYDDWISKFKNSTLDSLQGSKIISSSDHKKYIADNHKKFFWDFFRDYELGNRVKKMNAFQPDLSIVIHYNVDEKNSDWKKPTEKNFTMCFIGGGMGTDIFEKNINKINFLRLLLSDDLDKSEKISSLTVHEFSKQLGIKIASKEDADYLKDKCVKTSSEGVYCRNLAICRGVKGPLVYGECLYQDNYKECMELIKSDKTFSNIKTNQRVKTVADAYFNAIKKYFQ